MKDTDSIKRELHARIDPIIEDVAREIARGLGDVAIFMTRAEYAKHRKVGVKVVSRWVNAGLPCRGSGKSLRVKVAEADEWNEEDATRRSAEMNAHGAKR